MNTYLSRDGQSHQKGRAHYKKHLDPEEIHLVSLNLDLLRRVTPRPVISSKITPLKLWGICSRLKSKRPGQSITHKLHQIIIKITHLMLRAFTISQINSIKMKQTNTTSKLSKIRKIWALSKTLRETTQETCCQSLTTITLSGMTVSRKISNQKQLWWKWSPITDWASPSFLEWRTSSFKKLHSS
jgi:hypothetical protein